MRINMKFVIQRVSQASVTVDNKLVGQIGKGFLVFIGIGQNDTKETADKMIKKMCGLRIFSDENDKINLSLSDVNGGLLLISQFTLYADCRKGFRPSFTRAGSPDIANELYEYIVTKSGEYIHTVEKGVFGAHMNISLENDGPFTVILETDNEGNII